MTSPFVRYILCVLVTCSSLTISSQGFHSFLAAKQVALANNYLLSGGVESMYGNPAGLMEQDYRWASILSVTRRFNSDIQSVSGALAHRGSHQSLGMMIGSYGITGFRYNQASLGYARSLSEATRLGLQLNYTQLSIREYGVSSGLTMNVGIQHEISSKLMWGLSIFNLFDSKENDGKKFSRLNMSVSGKLSTDLMIFGSTDIGPQQKSNLGLGLTYRIIDPMSIYWSMNTAPAAFNYGIEFLLIDNWALMLTLNSQQLLGSSIFFSTRYIIN